MKRLIENLNGTNENHIFPFFWQHGEEEQKLREYMKKIEESGIRAICVEARPHPDFLKKKWWQDFDVILDEAKKREIKIWILDDSHFPTGYANGAVEEKYPQYRKLFLKLYQLDFAGPMEYAQAMISHAFSDKEDKLEGVFLAKKKGYEEIDASEVYDITIGVKDNKTVSFELPEGEWKVLVLISTYKGGEPETEGYLNPIVPEAVDVLLDTVYEPHYAHYKEEFGKTILGFFSDEPRFGNMHGPYGSIGRFDMVLPWRVDMVELLNGKAGMIDRKVLPLLFLDGGEKAHHIRYKYMDLVSDLYAENFSQRIGNWCREHGVEYIGHVIEDNNASARLGYGAGHFFRAMKGQDMAGIDVVLHQLMPGMDHCYNKAMTKRGWDGEFFHYALAKLGASLGHIDPKKKGRVMCEVFGAYGWAEGNRMMKWITDHMLVRGVNEFCPHAFSLKDYPDPDCPPHFYAHGKNPQYPEFEILMNYMNRLSHLLSGGIHRAPVAVSYHGEAEWSGDYMLVQKPCAELARNQIDYDILPQQSITESEVKDGKLLVNKEIFKALIVPYAEALPAAYLKKLERAAVAGLKVYFLDKLPTRSSEGVDVEEVLDSLKKKENVFVTGLEHLVSALLEQGIFEVSCSTYEPYLRYYHYEQEDGHILMVVNEAPGHISECQAVNTELQVPFEGRGFRYDAFANKLEETVFENKIPLKLSPYESTVFCWPKDASGLVKLENVKTVTGKENLVLCYIKELKGPFKVSFAKQENYPEFTDEMILEKLVPMQQVKGKEDFAGVIRYEIAFDLDEPAAETKIGKVKNVGIDFVGTRIILDTVYEGARLSVNGSGKQLRICPPYSFDVSETVKYGKNTLVIEVTTTLLRERYDLLSQFMLMEPVGITKAVILERYS